MPTIITGFKTREDVHTMIQALNSRGWEWNEGPYTEHTEIWKKTIGNLKKNDIFYLEYGPRFNWGIIQEGYKIGNAEEISFHEAIKRIETWKRKRERTISGLTIFVSFTITYFAIWWLLSLL